MGRNDPQKIKQMIREDQDKADRQVGYISPQARKREKEMEEYRQKLKTMKMYELREIIKKNNLKEPQRPSRQTLVELIMSKSPIPIAEENNEYDNLTPKEVYERSKQNATERMNKMMRERGIEYE